MKDALKLLEKWLPAESLYSSLPVRWDYELKKLKKCYSVALLLGARVGSFVNLLKFGDRVVGVDLGRG